MYTTGKRHSLPIAQQDNKEMALLQNRRKSETSGGENEKINIQKESYENSRKQICRIGSIKFNSVMNKQVQDVRRNLFVRMVKILMKTILIV